MPEMNIIQAVNDALRIEMRRDSRVVVLGEDVGRFGGVFPVAPAQLAEIESMVNAEIRRNVEAEVHQMGYQEALDFGAMALFGEKYGENVRVLKMGEFSTELCGGTHVHRTGDIGVFKILGESGVASGVRRIEAVTGQGALDHVADEEHRLLQLARMLGGGVGDAEEKLRKLDPKSVG